MPASAKASNFSVLVVVPRTTYPEFKSDSAKGKPNQPHPITPILVVKFDGFYLDNGIGHVGSNSDEDDIAFFDKLEDISYSWDRDGIGIGGARTGINAIAFLESPGIYNDNIDNAYIATKTGLEVNY